MKFDSIMDFLYKSLCVVTAAVCVAGLCVSCVFDGAITASAIRVPKWYWDYLNQTSKDFLELEEVKHDLVQPRVTDAVQSSSLTSSEKQDILSVYGLQESFFNELDNEFSRSFLQSPVLPSTFSIDDHSAIGVYISALDGLAHAVQIYTFSQSGEKVCSSDEFDVTISIADSSGGKLIFDSYETVSSSYLSRGLYVHPDGLAFGLTLSLSQTGNYFASLPSYTAPSNVGQIYAFSKISRLTSNYSLSRTDLNYFFTSNNGSTVGGMGVIADLPADSVDTTSVWDYYNDVLLPHIRETYPNVSDDYIFFPSGYTPQEPTEPPTFPNGGIIINNNDYFYISSDTVVVTDVSGVPVTDASGETATETVYVTDTSPTDAVYNFSIPTLPALETPSGDFPLFSPGSDLVQACSGFFSGMTDFYTETGLDEIVPVFVAFSAIILLAKVLL